MIRWNIKRDRGLVFIKIAGHAEYDVKGKDVVCSAVSSVVLNTCNILETLGYLVRHTNEEEIFTAIVKGDSLVANKICLVLFNELIDLEKQYPNNIKKVDYVDSRDIVNE